MRLKRTKPRRCWFPALAVVVAGLLLAGCSLLVDPGEARLCRQLIAGQNPGVERFTFISVQSIRRPADAEGPATSGVHIVYEIQDGAYRVRRRFIGCQFVRDRAGAIMPRHLQDVWFDDGPPGPVRTYIARRFWLDTAEGAAADPEPVSGQMHATPISRPSAVVLQNLLAGLPHTGIYMLMALATGLVHGLVGRANLAFGDIAALGSYGAILGVALAGGSAAVPLAVVAGLLVGAWSAASHAGIAHRLVFAPLAERPGQGTLIASAALGLCLAEAVRLIQGSGARPSPPLLDMPLAVARAGEFIVTTTPMALITAVAAGSIAFGVLMAMGRSTFGRSWRAAADDPLAAALMGIDIKRLGLGAFAVAGLLLGIAGGLVTLNFGVASHGTGLALGLKGVIAAILGGAGSLGGAVAAGLAIGLVEALWPICLPIEHRDAGIFTLIAAALVLRPGGFWGWNDGAHVR